MTGARILRECLDRLGNNWEAIGCYNATNRTKRAGYSWKVYRELQKADNSGPRSLPLAGVTQADAGLGRASRGKIAIPMVSEMRITDAE